MTQMKTKYSDTFKIEAVKKVLLRSGGASKVEIASSLGIANSTLHGWVKAVENKDLSESPTSVGFDDKKIPQWTAQEKFEIIVSTANLSQEQLSEYCRKKGIFPHHVKAWKQDFIDGSTTQNSSKQKSETKALKNEVKKLAKELRRKDRALAETAALLVLKKKVEDYWGLDEED